MGNKFEKQNQTDKNRPMYISWKVLMVDLLVVCAFIFVFSIFFVSSLRDEISQLLFFPLLFLVVFISVIFILLFITFIIHKPRGFIKISTVNNGLKLSFFPPVVFLLFSFFINGVSLPMVFLGVPVALILAYFFIVIHRKFKQPEANFKTSVIQDDLKTPHYMRVALILATLLVLAFSWIMNT